ncbi:MAG: hypothetical protein ACM3VS_05995 [Candidatus Dadabacteria bacterium]
MSTVSTLYAGFDAGQNIMEESEKEQKHEGAVKQRLNQCPYFSALQLTGKAWLNWFIFDGSVKMATQWY